VILTELARGLADALLPSRCAGCDGFAAEPFCPICCESLVPARPFAVPGLASAAACFEYGAAIAEAIVRLKYDRREDIGRVLAAMLVPHVRPGFDLVVPIPLSRRRLVERGFNQAEILCRAIPLPKDVRALIRTTDGPPQALSSREQRARNVRGAFRARSSGSVSRKRVLLVDDVITTGATARAAASALLAAGASTVSLLALARSEP
jgi:ComF family protein